MYPLELMDISKQIKGGKAFVFGVTSEVQKLIDDLVNVS
jgi:hypothetical protein